MTLLKDVEARMWFAADFSDVLAAGDEIAEVLDFRVYHRDDDVTPQFIADVLNDVVAEPTRVLFFLYDRDPGRDQKAGVRRMMIEVRTTGGERLIARPLLLVTR
jgi:hypothetical protein